MASLKNALNGCRVLLTNDDGIGAPGLKVLQAVARELTDDIWVCAPQTEQSGAGHSLSLHSPVRIRRYSTKRFSVAGTPTDCVLMALHEIMRGKLPDLVLSGVNRGSNMGEDITYSGTVAAAMESTLLGVPAIALSQHVGEGHRTVHWATAQKYAPDIIRRLWHTGWGGGVLMNVNFPDVVANAVEGTTIAVQGQRKIGENLDRRVDPRGRPYYWIGTLRNEAAVKSGTDIAAVEGGYIAVTPVHLDLTHKPSLKSLREAFA